MPTIRPGAPLIAVGEAPGANEVSRGVGFVGVSGEILDAALASGGVERASISVSNAILCRPPEEGNFAEYVEGLRAGYLRALKRWHKVWLTADEMTLPPPRRDTLARARWKADCSDRDPEMGGLPAGPPPMPVLPQEACRPRLERDLAESDSTVVLAVGKQALESVRTIMGLETTKSKGAQGALAGAARVAPIKKQHGAPVLLEDEAGRRRVLMTTYHPAMALRDKPQYLDVIKSNVRRAAEIARAGGRIRWTEPDFLLAPDEDLVHRTLDRYADAFARGLCTVGLTVDIETDGIDPHVCMLRCVGLGADIAGQGEVLLCIPFRRMDGSQWWSDPAAKIRIARHLREVLDSLPLVFQNGNYDTTVLLRLGIMTQRRRTWVDTLLLHKDTPDNDLPHDLGFIVRRFYDPPLWKEDVDHKGTADAAATIMGEADPEAALAGADRELHVYNLKDVLGTLRVVPPLWASVVASETTPQLETDTAMLPVIRDMSELGLVVNEWQRGVFSAALNKSCHELRARFQELVGRRINPRSPQQLRELFYVDWSYVPVVATDGYEFEPEADDVEDGSTSNQALTRLQVDRIVDERHPHWAAIETLLAFRANDKLRGTYVDKLPTTAVDWAAHGMAVGGADAVRGWVYDAARDLDVEVEILPPRSGLSITRTTYKNHVVPTGRLASGDPLNIQNIPISARGGLNLREMFVAPPGHAIVGADYCLAPGTKVLTADMRWTPIDDLEVGEVLVGFDEHGASDARMRRSTIEAIAHHVRPCYEVETDKGVIIASAEHCWLNRRPRGSRRWVRTDELKVGSLLAYFCDPWEEDRSYDGAWLAGFMDGEGYVNGGGQVGFGQNSGAILDHACQLLFERDFDCGFSPTTEKCIRVQIKGCRSGLRFLGMIRPRRLLPKAASGWEGSRTWGARSTPATVKAVRYIGKRSTIALQTSTRTFVAEGYLTHNCQIEARLYAVIAQDQVLLDTIRRDLDIHSMNAAALFMEPGDRLMDRYEWVKTRPDSEKKHIRTVAKKFAFGCIYGADWPKIYSLMVAERSKATGERTFPNVTEDDCKRWAENWHKLHPETAAWHARVHAGCAAYGFSGSPMLDFRKRFFRDGAAQENAIPNMTIQASAAAIANRALLAIAEQIPYRGWSYWSGPVYQIHDYLGVVVPEGRWEEAKRIVEKCMFYSWNGMDFTATANPSWTLGQQ